MRRNALVVLGVHRSGTSALAGALARTGVHPGTTMLPATADNPEGYWESAPLVALDERLLHTLGSRWDSPAPLPEDWPTLAGVRALRAEAAKIIADEFGAAQRIVVKDPRLCRLLPFWRAALSEAGYDVSAVLQVRQPSQVAASLGRRDRFSREKSLSLWFTHLLEAERGSRGLPRVLMTYDALLADPVGTLTALGTHASFPLPSAVTDQAKISAIVRPDLRRHASGPDVRERARAPFEEALDKGYAALAALAPDVDPQPPIEALAQAAAPAFAAMIPPWLMDELRNDWRADRQLAEDLDAARRHIVALDAEINRLRADAAEQAKAAVMADLASLRGDRAAIKADVEQSHAALTASIGTLGAAVGALQGWVEAREREELEQQRAAVAAAHTAAAETATRIEMLERDLDRARQEAGATAAQLQGVAQELGTARAQRDTVRAALEGARAELARLDRDWLGRWARRRAEAIRQKP